MTPSIAHNSEGLVSGNINATMTMVVEEGAEMVMAYARSSIGSNAQN